ncbi:hypothetical protein ACOZ4I_04545 [Haloarcula salina]|uniref:hypothetical protein n=1 Tax=Haloarcula salina TaxID=1429914 RepID=UPI003C6F4FD4
MTSDGSDETRSMATKPDVTSGYRWTCPFCEKSQTNYLSGGEDEASVVQALEAHIRVSDGKGHGEAHTIPEEIDADSLTSYIVETD